MPNETPKPDDQGGCWTVSVPWAPPDFATMWHPPSPTGPFAVLQRGAFASQHEAVVWGRKHLNGTPYTVKRVGD